MDNYKKETSSKEAIARPFGKAMRGKNVTDDGIKIDVEAEFVKWQIEVKEKRGGEE